MRQRKLNAMAHGIIRSRGAAWIPSQKVCKHIDHEHRKLMATILKIHFVGEFTGEQFRRKRNREISETIDRPWSHIFLTSAISWLSHVQRHEDSIAAHAWRERNSEWLQTMRAIAPNKGAKWKRVGLRASAGRPWRWDEGGWSWKVNPKGTRDKQEISDLAQKLYRHLRGEETVNS